MEIIDNINRLDELLQIIESLNSDGAKREAWASIKIDKKIFAGFPERLVNFNPFSYEYKLITAEFLKYLHGADYRLECEGFNFDLNPLLTTGFPYTSQSAHIVGSYLISYGYVIKQMNLPVPSKILEMGCGFGSLSIHLARMGYDLTVVDVNKNFVDHVEKLCSGSPIRVKAIASDMNSLELFDEYDAIIFYESFHHSHDHARTVERLAKLLKRDGLLVLAAEPIVKERSEILPYPWGPRLDGESLRAMRRFKWIELGFTEEYIYDLMSHKGLTCRRVSSNETHWADLLICKKVDEIISGVEYLFNTAGSGQQLLVRGWSVMESWGTWSEGKVAKILLNLSCSEFARGARVILDIKPFVPDGVVCEFSIFINTRYKKHCKFEWHALAEDACIDIRIDPEEIHKNPNLILEFGIKNPISPRDLGLSEDTRSLSLGIKRLVVHPVY